MTAVIPSSRRDKGKLLMTTDKRQNTYRPMRSKTGKLLGEVDPVHRLLRLKVGGHFYHVQLDEYLKKTQEFSQDEKDDLQERVDRLEKQMQAIRNMPA